MSRIEWLGRNFTRIGCKKQGVEGWKDKMLLQLKKYNVTAEVSAFTKEVFAKRFYGLGDVVEIIVLFQTFTKDVLAKRLYGLVHNWQLKKYNVTACFV